MSRERIAATRRVFDGWARGDFRAVQPQLDPNVLLVIRPEFPESGVYLGPEGIAGYMRELLSSWSDFTIRAEEVVGAGDSVVVRVAQRGVGRSSGVVTELRYFQVLTWRGETIIRIESAMERAVALALVGSTE